MLIRPFFRLFPRRAFYGPLPNHWYSSSSQSRPPSTYDCPQDSKCEDQCQSVPDNNTCSTVGKQQQHLQECAKTVEICPEEPQLCSPDERPPCEPYYCQPSENPEQTAEICPPTCESTIESCGPCASAPCQEPCEYSEISRLANLSAGPTDANPLDGLSAFKKAINKRRCFQPKKILEKDSVDLSVTTGVPQEQLSSRMVYIYKGYKHVMQQGTDNTQVWEILWDTGERWENPLIGWASTADPMGGVTIQFGSQLEAERWCTRNGWKYVVLPPREPAPIPPKSYGDIFSWNRRCRVSTK